MIRRFLEFAGPLGFIRALFFAAIVAGSSVATAEASPAAINPRPSSVVGLEPTLAAVAPAGGPIAGGTTITLTGTNLGGAIEVTVGGVAATDLIVLDETTLTAVTPSGAVGARDVAVTTPSGTATLVGAFTYVTVPVWATVVEPLPDPAVVTSGSLRAAILATGFPWRVRDNATNIEMVLIPPGTFNMGCSASNQFGCSSGENPVHAVTLTNAFYMGRYEVTQAQWTARMGSNPSFAQTASAQVPLEQVSSRPVEQVTWNIVQRFLASTGMRLPTEAEWEYAYRAGTTTAFHGWPAQTSGTNDEALVGDIAWFSGNSTSQSRPVGGKAPNGFGLYDMAGNVFEWVNDWYSGTYYASSPSTNPPGPATGTLRVARGGGWDYSSDWMRSSFRPWLAPGNWWKSVGFRVVRSLSGTAPTVTDVSPASGPTTGGTLITITGENLLNTTSVLIDGRAATAVTVVSSTVVSAVTPSGLSLGAKDILVTTPGGVAIAAGAFIYTAPAPTITSIAPSFGPVIGGTPITISGTALTGATSVTVGGAPATNVTVVSATTVTAVTPPGVPGSAVISITTPTGTATAAGLFFYADVTDWATVLEVAPDPAVVTNATLRSAIIASGFPWRVRDNLTQIEMLLVPPGSFTMGCSASAQFNCGGSETPLRTVTLTNPFYLGRYEVTQAQWTAVTGLNRSYFSGPNYPNSENRPAEQVSWINATDFCTSRGFRLPTEAEWEYACRAGTTTAYHSMPGYPDGFDDQALAVNIGWNEQNSGNQTHNVGQLAPNGFGFHDMSGNVSEWCSDWQAPYSAKPQTNPTGGPPTSGYRVLRGNAFNSTPFALRSSKRWGFLPNFQFSWIMGFRVARNP
jgi:formylglycine-generating enzyme required for sulfatase activity